MAINQLREILIENWVSLGCTYVQYIEGKLHLERPCIKMPFILKSIANHIENLLKVTQLNREKQILQETLNLIKSYNDENKYIVELNLNKKFLEYIKTIDKNQLHSYFGSAKEIWEDALNGVKIATEMLSKEKK